MMHQSEFDAANVALSRAADKRKSLINIHENWYTATLNRILFRTVQNLIQTKILRTKHLTVENNQLYGMHASEPME